MLASDEEDGPFPEIANLLDTPPTASNDRQPCFVRIKNPYFETTEVPPGNLSPFSSGEEEDKEQDPDFEVDELPNPSRPKPSKKKRLSNASKKLISKKCKNDTAGSHDSTAAILSSFDAKVGIGAPLHVLLQGYEESSDLVAAFLLFVTERQAIWKRRWSGREPFTTNSVMADNWITNMYRELDRGTTFFRSHILNTAMRCKKVSTSTINLRIMRRVLFKSVCYRLMNKLETFQEFGKLPDLADWEEFAEYLNLKMANGEKIFTAAHQNMGLSNYLQTLKYISEHIDDIAEQISSAAQQRKLKNCYMILKKIPNVGPFFAWQIICDLLELNLLGKTTENQWTCLGPGAKRGLARIFCSSERIDELELTRLLTGLCRTSGAQSGFKALNINFPRFLGRDLTLKNIEHALCEFEKYCQLATGGSVRQRSFNAKTSRVHLDENVKCGNCFKLTASQTVQTCPMCNRKFHMECVQDVLEDTRHNDSTWLCRECFDIVQEWPNDDYAEHDSSSTVKRRSKAVSSKRNKVEKKEIEMVFLSESSEEECGNSYLEVQMEQNEFETECDSDIEIVDEIVPNGQGLVSQEDGSFSGTQVFDGDDEDDEKYEFILS